MTSVVTVLRRGLVRADDALVAVRDRMTPGQRWTATILAAISLAVVLYAAPSKRVVVPLVDQGVSGGAATAAPEAARAPFIATTPSGEDLAPPALPDSGRRVSIAGPVRSTTGGSSSDAAPIRVSVLLPAADSGALPGRDERSVAQAFLTAPGFELASTATVGDADACTSVGGSGTLVLAPESVPDDLVACVRNSGATLVAFDRAGTRDGVVSTRRAEPAGLVALAGWAAAAKDVLDGKVGVVGSAADKPWIEATLPQLRSAGLDVVATAFPSDAGSVGSDVRAFAAAGVEGVILAAPAEIRRQWSAQHAIADPGVRFIVADAHDGVADESYAPSFDGALAHTSLRVPWFSRTHGETAEQAVCRQQWEASARRLLAGDETRWVYAWCQHVSAAAAAVRLAGESGKTAPAALRELRIPSPLTSDLGPAARTWGPTQSAVVVWRASCRCWQEQARFS